MDEEYLTLPSFHLAEQTYTQSYFTLSITEILGPEHYFTLFERLRNSTPHDILQLRLASPGGRLDAGMMIYNIMKDHFSQRTEAYIDSSAASMAGLLFLSSDKRIVYPHSLLMIHESSVGLRGKTSELLTHINTYKKSYDVLYNQLCGDLLTEKEHELISHGSDFFLTTKEMCERDVVDMVIYNGEGLKPDDYLLLLKDEKIKKKKKK